MRIASLQQKFKLSSTLPMRWNSSRAKFKLVEEVEQLMENEQIKPRKHPGIVKRRLVELPNWVISAINNCLDDNTRPKILKEREDFGNYLFSRRLPVEDAGLKKMYAKIEQDVIEKKYSDVPVEEIDDKRNIIKGEVKQKLKQKVFNWKPIEYNKYYSLLYLITRSAHEYAVLDTIFNEIKVRDPQFCPQTIFDFGSGVGSVFWAATVRWKNIKEYLAIDISNDMNDLSEQIIKLYPKRFKGNFHRQYIPFSNLKHDIVISAYSLMELPTAKSRLDVIAKLWKVTNKYLIIVEQGTNAGFKLVNEARDFVKYLTKTKAYRDTDYFIFSPCAHEMPCPRYEEGHSPCNFLIQHSTLPMLGPMQHHYELYSYIVIKKGLPTENDNWSRLVRPTLIRSKHARCRLCTAQGKLEEVVFTASKHGKILYRCAKASGWGDRLPVKLNPTFIGSKNKCDESQEASIIKNENENDSEDTLDQGKEELNHEKEEDIVKAVQDEVLVSEGPKFEK